VLWTLPWIGGERERPGDREYCRTLWRGLTPSKSNHETPQYKTFLIDRLKDPSEPVEPPVDSAVDHEEVTPSVESLVNAEGDDETHPPATPTDVSPTILINADLIIILRLVLSLLVAIAINVQLVNTLIGSSLIASMATISLMKFGTSPSHYGWINSLTSLISLTAHMSMTLHYTFQCLMILIVIAYVMLQDLCLSLFIFIIYSSIVNLF
jgi:hypothetical protein